MHKDHQTTWADYAGHRDDEDGDQSGVAAFQHVAEPRTRIAVALYAAFMAHYWKAKNRVMIGAANYHPPHKRRFPLLAQLRGITTTAYVPPEAQTNCLAS